MTLVQGRMTDVSYSVIDYTTTRIAFVLNNPNVTAAGTMIADRPKWLTTDASGAFTVELAPTDQMIGRAYYTVLGEYFEETVDGGSWVALDVLPIRMYVPTTGDVLNLRDLTTPPNTPVSPDPLVWVGEENNTAYQFWYQPSTANLFQNT